MSCSVLCRGKACSATRYTHRRRQRGQGSSSLTLVPNGATSSPSTGASYDQRVRVRMAARVMKRSSRPFCHREVAASASAFSAIALPTSSPYRSNSVSCSRRSTACLSCVRRVDVHLTRDERPPAECPGVFVVAGQKELRGLGYEVADTTKLLAEFLQQPHSGSPNAAGVGGGRRRTGKTGVDQASRPLRLIVTSSQIAQGRVERGVPQPGAGSS